ncbi:sugar ABC transporter permease [Chromatiales bacterium (ex Bugula neritina AB1)]|nr:sugar ABC transporter permease [Chromatiales bacterium (ex Bugula neritina AB1)]
MTASTFKVALRYIVSIILVGIFIFPIAWFALTSVKPISAVFNKDKVVVFDFQPTFENYQVTVLGGRKSDTSSGSNVLMGTSGEGAYDGRGSIASSLIIAISSTFLATSISLLAAYALSRMSFRGSQGYMHWILSQRFLPPIAIIIPLVFIFRDLGLRDTHFGIIIAHTLINIPIALLILKSFFDDVPVEIDQAAMIDGASRLQCFYLVVLPMVKGGIAATAVLCFIFSWTEFLLSLFLTNSIRTIPVKITTFVTSTGSEWGYISALGTAAIIPGFIFILLVQNHLVRGLTMGAIKD